MNIEDNRRVLLALDAVAMTSLGVIGLWQVGILKTLPEPTSQFLNAAKVNGSPEAYKWGVPDAFLGFASYAVTASLALAGSDGRIHKRPWLAAATGGKALLDAVQAVRMTHMSWKKFHAFSLWSLIVVGATLAAAPFAVAAAAGPIADRQVRGAEGA